MADELTERTPLPKLWRVEFKQIRYGVTYILARDEATARKEATGIDVDDLDMDSGDIGYAEMKLREATEQDVQEDNFDDDPYGDAWEDGPWTDIVEYLSDVRACAEEEADRLAEIKAHPQLPGLAESEDSRGN